MKAIVTGGAGFIGSHLCDHLLSNQVKVTCLDNLSKGSLSNINHLRDHSHFSFLEVDVYKERNLKAIFQEATHIFHLAGYADIVPSIENPVEYFNNNVTATINVLEAAKSCSHLEKLCFAASSSCYGIPDKYPTSEREEIKPEYPYALTKRMAEEAVLHWGKVYKLPVLSLRLFNAYGPRARTKNAYGAVMGTFLAQAAQGKPLTIVGDGKQKRDFIYVTDVARAFYLAAQSPHKNEVFNIGAGNPREINYLASLISPDKTYIEKRPGEPDQTYADISKAKKALNWEPLIQLEEGINLIKDSKENWAETKAWSPDEIKEATKSWFEALKN